MQIDGDTCRVDAAVGGGDAVQTKASVWYVAHLCGDVGRAEQLTADHYGSERFPRAWKGQRVVVVNRSKALAILTTCFVQQVEQIKISQSRAICMA